MSFTFQPATRDRIGLLWAIGGASGSGKTLSALLLARALANGEKIAVIDTEARRAKHYADKFDFLHCDFGPPFTPERYTEAVKAAEEVAPVILIDSASHEWSGEGGCADIQAAEAERMATDKNGKLIAWKVEAMTAPAWKKPKIRHKRMMSRFVQCRSHIIFCLRAEEKVKFVKEVVDGRERTTIVPIGFQPICEKEFMFEMSGSLTLHPDTPGTVRYDLRHKLNDDLRDIFRDGQMITEESGRRLREWAERGADTRVTPAEQKIIDAVRDLTARVEDSSTMGALIGIDAESEVKRRREWLKVNRPQMSLLVEEAFAAARDRLERGEDEAEAA